MTTAAGAAVPTRATPSQEAERFGKPPSGWRRTWFEIIFESQTRAGRTFDLVLLTVIVASVLVVILDSVSTYAARHGPVLNALEWTVTALFTVEYVARLVVVQRPWRYATSFFGIVDLMSVLPTYLAFFFPELHALIDIRLLRLLRVFRILKLTQYLTEIQCPWRRATGQPPQNPGLHMHRAHHRRVNGHADVCRGRAAKWV